MSRLELGGTVNRDGTAGAFFTSYESLKYLLGSLSGSSKTSSLSFISLPTPLLHSLASSTAELVSCAILTPAEVIKQNAQIASRSPSTAPAGHRHGPKTNITLEVLRKLRRRPARLWSGYTALVARNLPFTGLQFPIYEELKRKLEGWRDEKILLPKQKQMGKEAVAEPDVHVSLHMGTTAVSAGVAGSVAAGVTTPIDVIKTRIMLGAGEERDTAAGVGQQEKLGRDSPGRGGRGKMTLWSVGRDILNKEGVRGLFRGGVLRSAWTALGLGLYLGSYEGGRKFLEYRREGKTKVKCPR